MFNPIKLPIYFIVIAGTFEPMLGRLILPFQACLFRFERSTCNVCVVNDWRWRASEILPWERESVGSTLFDFFWVTNERKYLTWTWTAPLISVYLCRLILFSSPRCKPVISISPFCFFWCVSTHLIFSQSSPLCRESVLWAKSCVWCGSCVESFPFVRHVDRFRYYWWCDAVS